MSAYFEQITTYLRSAGGGSVGSGIFVVCALVQDKDSRKLFKERIQGNDSRKGFKEIIRENIYKEIIQGSYSAKGRMFRKRIELND